MMRPAMYLNEQAEVGLIINLLTGEALAWASPLLEWADPIHSHFEEFIKMFLLIFDDPNWAHTTETTLQFFAPGSQP